jgi:DNA polymerase-1
MAHISRDESLLRAFAAGEDIHRATAAEIFGVDVKAVDNEQRRYAKVINFGLIYGMSAFGLARQLNLERAAAQQYMDRYFQRYPGVAEYMRVTREQAHQQGYVETVFGRRLWLPEIRSSNGNRRQGAERADARHRRRSDQAGDHRRAEVADRAADEIPADHAGA